MTVHRAMTDRVYLWQTGKASRRVHILNPGTDRTFCQTENGVGRPLDGKGAEVPAGRRLCQNCTDLAGRDETDYREPDVRVLMGERLDLRPTAEPDLFANGAAPKPWKRKKQVRAARRSKGRKARHSEAKHPRPFNDDLPW